MFIPRLKYLKPFLAPSFENIAWLFDLYNLFYVGQILD
jgi:hypothetical protein